MMKNSGKNMPEEKRGDNHFANAPVIIYFTKSEIKLNIQLF